MRRARLIRFYLLEVVLPTLTGISGLLFLFGVGREELLPWHLPLIAGMLGTALVAIGGARAEDPEDRT
jgi:hypothetical protein